MPIRICSVKKTKKQKLLKGFAIEQLQHESAEQFPRSTFSCMSDCVAAVTEMQTAHELE